ncbi:hypothetical protein SDC9_141534 [bioreactor metagenome]|uniref:Uncharacterized protein n=1 Tax=bioreactor metagenome TaxID=1076179 RepID=A0A645DZ24_9ZZZZ
MPIRRHHARSALATISQQVGSPAKHLPLQLARGKSLFAKHDQRIMRIDGQASVSRHTLPIGLQIGAHARRAEDAQWIHRHQTTEDPQHQHGAKGQPGDMVPAHLELAVWRLCARLVAASEPPAPYAHQCTRKCRDGTQCRQADDQPAPYRVPRTVAKHVEPVQPCAHVVPVTLMARRMHHHFTRSGRDIQQVGSGIVHLHLDERSMRIKP